jgi:hypothetical protein
LIEFNRIDLGGAVRSRAAELLDAACAKAANLTIFYFEGSRLALRLTLFSVFITMNPGA